MEKIKDVKYLIAVNIIFIIVCILSCCLIVNNIKKNTKQCDCPKCEAINNGVKEESITNNENSNEQINENSNEGDLCNAYHLNPFKYGLDDIDYSSNNISKVDYKEDFQNSKVTLTAYKSNTIVWEKSFDVPIGGQQDYFDLISIDGSDLYLQVNGKITILNLESGNIVKELTYSDDYSVLTVLNIYEDLKYIFISVNLHPGYSSNDGLVIIDKENKIIKNIINNNDYSKNVFYNIYNVITENDNTYLMVIKKFNDGCQELKYNINDLLSDNFSF